MRRVRVVAVLLMIGFAASLLQAEERAAVPLWGRFGHSFSATGAAPETELHVEFSSPSGKTYERLGFWNGGYQWKVRFMPTELGKWTYRTRSQPEVSGLHGQQGEFEVSKPVGYYGRFSKHGPVQVAEDGRHLAHADGTPFFWLADTAWNGALLSKPEDWQAYLQQRAEQQYSAIQFVTTQWRTAYANAEGEKAYTADGKTLKIHPEFFDRMDRRIDAINEQGLLAVPVLLWALGDAEYTPGKLPEEQAIQLAKYLVARYGAHHVVWILAGDENYSKTAERWKRIGRAVFGEGEQAPVTLHPQGMQWAFDSFRDEKWLDLLIYQSGHGDDPNTLRWIHSGPVSQVWTEETRPIINSEPPYEAHVAYQSRKPHSAYNVRRAVYWSLLNAPTAGVTYGGHGIWSWQQEPGEPLNHRGTGEARPWHEALQLPGSQQMQYVAELFTSLPWWKLRPVQGLLSDQSQNPAEFVAVSATDDRDLLVAYLPVGGTVNLQPRATEPLRQGYWFNPRSGEKTAAKSDQPGRYSAPDNQDWVLVLAK